MPKCIAKNCKGSCSSQRSLRSRNRRSDHAGQVHVTDEERMQRKADRQGHTNTLSLTNIHSFKNLYSASSRKLLHRGSPDTITVKKNSFKTIIQCIGKCTTCRY